MNDSKSDLFADFDLAGTDRFNILLIKHDMIWPRRQIEYALLGGGNAMEDTQKQSPSLAPTPVVAGSAARPLPEQRRYACDYEIPLGANRASPRPP
jgi:hypothetical protein